MPFDEVVEIALYHPDHGFYSAGGSAGRRGDFITSPEVGPLFGAVLGRALDSWWAELGEPDPFVVVECGAGPGSLAVALLASTPRCAPALRYVLVERSARQAARHADHLTVTPPPLALGPAALDAEGVEQPVERGVGPVVTSLRELPSLPGPVVVLANELLDNLPFRVLQRTLEGWAEVRVGLGRSGDLVEVLVPADERLDVLARRLAPDAPTGGRVPVQDAAAGWLRAALDLAGAGRVLTLDYAATTAELAARVGGDWLRTYAAHQRGTDVLGALGATDITADVCVDQLARVRTPDRDRSQADFLADHGVADLVDEGRRRWEAGAATGDLEALKGRSRVREAEALLDPAGLGGFRALEWLGG